MPLIRKPSERLVQPAQTNDEVLKSLTSADPEQRWAAARGAADIEGADQALSTAIRMEKDARVREAMFTSLAKIGSPNATSTIISLVRSDEANIRTGALDALHGMVAQLHDLLPKLLDDAEVDVRILCCELARALPSAEASRLMCAVLDKDIDVNVCAAAVDVLAEAGGIEALPSLKDCALRFRDSHFLAFAIKIVVDRLSAKSAAPRA